MSKVGRNDPCPCGSGKKYKKCCGQKSSIQRRSFTHLTKDNRSTISGVVSQALEPNSQEKKAEELEKKLAGRLSKGEAKKKE